MSLDPVVVLHAALVVLALEVAVLAWRARDARLRVTLLSFLGAGASLLLAAIVALVYGPTAWFYALLTFGGVTQAWHLRRLWSLGASPWS